MGARARRTSGASDKKGTAARKQQEKAAARRRAKEAKMQKHAHSSHSETPGTTELRRTPKKPGTTELRRTPKKTPGAQACSRMPSTWHQKRWQHECIDMMAKHERPDSNQRPFFTLPPDSAGHIHALPMGQNWLPNGGRCGKMSRVHSPWGHLRCAKLPCAMHCKSTHTHK